MTQMQKSRLLIAALVIATVACADDGTSPGESGPSITGRVQLTGSASGQQGNDQGSVQIDDADGVKVYLTNSSGGIVDSTATIGGGFRFSGLPPGNYRAVACVGASTCDSSGAVNLVSGNLNLPAIRVGSSGGLPSAPNPFFNGTTFAFSLASAATTTLVVSDLDRRAVRRLIESEIFPAGLYEVAWNGRGDGGEALPDGAYLAILSVPGREEVEVVVKGYALDMVIMTANIDGQPFTSSRGCPAKSIPQPPGAPLLAGNTGDGIEFQGYFGSGQPLRPGTYGLHPSSLWIQSTEHPLSQGAVTLNRYDDEEISGEVQATFFGPIDFAATFTADPGVDSSLTMTGTIDGSPFVSDYGDENLLRYTARVDLCDPVFSASICLVIESPSGRFLGTHYITDGLFTATVSTGKKYYAESGTLDVSAVFSVLNGDVENWVIADAVFDFVGRADDGSTISVGDGRVSVRVE